MTRLSDPHVAAISKATLSYQAEYSETSAIETASAHE
jgi:hypothetical protein